jgi:hypothetical protein
MTKALLVGLALLQAGCSFYYSSESSWKSSTSPSRSSASSSPDDDDKDDEAYRNDIRDFTAAYASSRRDLDGFERGLGEVARRHGVTDWEADDATFVGIGAGLKRAGVSADDRAAYETAIGAGEPERSLIRRGWES